MGGVDRVRRWIESRGLAWEVIELPRPVRTVAEAAEAVGAGPEVIAKTVIAVCSRGVVAAVIPGDRRLDLSRLGSVAGECRLATPREVEEFTGYRVGGVPPSPLPEGVIVVVDESLLGRGFVYGGGGSDHALLRFSPRDLVEAVGAVVAGVSR